MVIAYNAFEDDPGGMFDLIEEMRDCGNKLAHATASYYRIKNIRALEMKADGMPVTLIENVIKGDSDVADMLLIKMIAEVEYRASVEALLARKANIKNINDQMNREWNA